MKLGKSSEDRFSAHVSTESYDCSISSSSANCLVICVLSAKSTYFGQCFYNDTLLLQLAVFFVVKLASSVFSLASSLSGLPRSKMGGDVMQE